MAGFRFPNESAEYRASRDELLEMEKALRAQVMAVAEKRRALPPGGKLKDDYVFERVEEDGSVHEAPFAELFGKHDQLLLYTMMFGPDWDAACPSCTSLVDGFNANYYPVSQHCAMAVVGTAGPEKFRDWAQFRNWTIPVYSGHKSSYLLDYAGFDTKDGALVAMMNAFRKTDAGIFHTWGSELVGHPMENGHPRHVDMVWLFWNLLDMSPDGRPDRPSPIQNYEHVFFTQNVLGGAS